MNTQRHNKANTETFTKCSVGNQHFQNGIMKQAEPKAVTQ